MLKRLLSGPMLWAGSWLIGRSLCWSSPEVRLAVARKLALAFAFMAGAWGRDASAGDTVTEAVDPLYILPHWLTAPVVVDVDHAGTQH